MVAHQYMPVTVHIIYECNYVTKLRLRVCCCICVDSCCAACTLVSGNSFAWSSCLQFASCFNDGKILFLWVCGCLHVFLVYLSHMSLRALTPAPLSSLAIVFCHLAFVFLGGEGRGRRWNWVEICQTSWCSPTPLPLRSAWMKVKRQTNKQSHCHLDLNDSFAPLTHVSL